MNPKKTKNYLFLILFLLVFQFSFAQQNWKEITTVKDLYQSYPETVKGIFDDLNLELKGLEKVNYWRIIRNLRMHLACVELCLSFPQKVLPMLILF